MKKLILFLLLFTAYTQAQTGGSPSYNITTTKGLKITNPSTVTSVNFIPAFDADGSTVSKIDPALLPLSTATINAINTAVSEKSNKYVYYVEDYRNNSVYESIWIQNLINSAPENSTFIFKNNTVYTINNELIPKKGSLFIGNGSTLKRANESKTTLSAGATNVSTSITVSSVPIDWKIGDWIHVFIGDSYTQTSRERIITNIVGNVITLNSALGGFASNESGSATYPNASGVRKIFKILAGEQFPIPKPYKVKDFVFDGNKTNNTSSYYWSFNAMVHNYGYGGEISDCYFKDAPNENIVCSGVKVINNYAQDLNGSFVHLSSPPISMGENIQGTLIQGNTAFRTNQVDPLKTDHSYAVVENSWNPGKLIVSGNYFEGVNNGAFANNFFYPNVAPNNLTDEVLINGNIFKNYTKIFQPLTVPNTSPNNMRSRTISNNIFIDCGSNDMALLTGGYIKFSDNQYSGNTTVTNNSQNTTEFVNFLNGISSNSSTNTFSTHFGGQNQTNGVAFGANSSNQALIEGFSKDFSSTNDLHFQLNSGKDVYFYGRGFFTGNVSVPNGVAALHAVNKGQLDAAVRPYKVYTALLTQTGTSNPTATVLENTLGATLTWTRTGAGSYNISASANVFTANKTGFIATPRIGAYTIGVTYGSIGNFTLDTRVASTNTFQDDVLLSTMVEVRVYN